MFFQCLYSWSGFDSWLACNAFWWLAGCFCSLGLLIWGELLSRISGNCSSVGCTLAWIRVFCFLKVGCGNSFWMNETARLVNWSEVVRYIKHWDRRKLLTQLKWSPNHKLSWILTHAACFNHVDCVCKCFPLLFGHNLPTRHGTPWGWADY